uniref:Cytochrome c oxidase subunit 3 n=1 Tax=Evania appendigaster TaxID=27486 RepID=C8YLX9_EVAAP|nr:cytochrome c oxidase subunit III [Evania appendigaster]ACL36004.1 cytochrome c oxidase subunit III [Evania appendigaster]
MKKSIMNHPFHMVTNSPWPIVTSFALLNSAMSATIMFHSSNIYYLAFNFLTLIIVIYQWWRDVIRESTYQGMHTNKVLESLKLGMIMFIASEVMFFFSFFWSFFHSMLASNTETGNEWPPLNIEMFNPYSTPLMNSIILISSGVTVTWAHMCILNNNKKECSKAMSTTIFLGIYFSMLQLDEYDMTSFSISDSVYGSLFFLMTGFHGIHVMVGTFMLYVSQLRMDNNHLSSIHHFGFESASWYWHFVDVVWLFLYISIYWWSY